MDRQPSKPRTPKLIVADGKWTRQPPGTKSRARLLRGLEDENPSPRRLWIAVAIMAALAVGVTVGRFLMP